MTYHVTNVSNTQYTSEAVTIKPAVEVEVSKEIYDYLNDVFGASGKFTFRTSGKPAKATKPTKVKEVKEIKEIKETKKPTSKK